MILAAVVTQGYTTQKCNPLLANAPDPMNAIQSIVCENKIKMLSVLASLVTQTTMIFIVKIISVPNEMKGSIIETHGAISPVPLCLESMLCSSFYQT